MFVKRPKRGEDDGDLLKFQEEFMHEVNKAPSAKVVRIHNQSDTTVGETSTPLQSSVAQPKVQFQPTDVRVEDVPEDASQGTKKR